MPKTLTLKTKKNPQIPDLKVQSQHIKKLAQAVGDFIRYWGFRKIHGQLWTQIYLSQEPLSGSELVKNLSVSKALVSPALKELLDYDLISAISTDGRTKKYKANEQVFEVIQNILKNREQRLVENAHKQCSALQKYEGEKYSSNSKINHDRLDALSSLISSALFALSMITLKSDDNPLSNWIPPEKNESSEL